MSSLENPQDDRTTFWLGREYLYHGMHDQCISTLKRHLDLPSAKWDEERCASMRLISKCYQEKNNFPEAEKGLFRAIAECRHVREPYLQMARLGYLEKNWPLVFLMTEKGLSITEKTGSYLSEPDSWGPEFYDLGAICTYRLELYEKSRDYAKIACELKPNDSRLKRNLDLIDSRLKEMQFSIS
jgi:tetratricopeptide (TPR) repeat protein